MEKRQIVRALVGFAMYLLVGPALLFICAGTLRWPMAWVAVGLLLVAVVVSRVLVARRNPELIKERASYAEANRAPAWDRPLVAISALYGPMLVYAVAGLDHRFEWPAPVPLWLQVGAVVVSAAAYAVATWAMVANPFFSANARIQEERGQVVVSAGPYRVVRHPAYATSLLSFVALPVMLDALWAWIPGLTIVAALVIRTRREDQLLQEGLAGYADYAQRTRYRLIPGIW